MLNDILNNCNIQFKENAQSLILSCPNCHKDKLYINKEKGFWTCFKCGDQGLRGPNIDSLLRRLGVQGAITEFTPAEVTAEPSRPVYVPQSFIPLDRPQAKRGLEYCLKRGVPLDVAAQYGLRYDVNKPGVVFLVKEFDKIVGWQRRSIDPACPKEFTKFTSPGFEKSKHFIFQEFIVGDAVIVAEGPFSAIKFARTGLPFVASMGKVISQSQVKKLKLLGIKRIYLALDPDAGYEANQFLLNNRLSFDIYFVPNVPNREDFGASTFEECGAAIRKSKKMIYPTEINQEAFKWLK